MRTVKIKVYTFNELNKEAQCAAIENYRNSNTDLDLTPFNESCEEQIEEAGFYDSIDLQYSLSYCQGDGLRFSCNKIKESVLFSFFAEILGVGKEKTAKVLINNCSFELTSNKSAYYCYASKSDIDYSLEDYGHHDTINCNIVVSKVLDKIENLYMKICKDLENQGYKYIEEIQSDEYITETLIANEYEFLASGKQFNYENK